MDNTFTFFKQFNDMHKANIIYEELISNYNDGLLIYKNDDYKIIGMNKKASQILGVDISQKKSLQDIKHYFEAEQLSNIEINKDVSNVEIRGDFYNVKSSLCDDVTVLFIIDKKDKEKSENLSQKALELSKELVDVFSEYGDDSIMVTDRNGIIEYAGTMISGTCGVDTDFFIGKNVVNIEKEGIFYPSVTVKVLNTLQSQVVIQKTKIGKELVSVGAPVFNNSGELEKVVSVTRNFSTQMKISKIIAELNDNIELSRYDKDKYNEEKLITCNDKMLEIKTLIKMIAGTDVTVLINGETGTGKEVIARYIHNLSDRNNSSFVKVNCGTISPSIVESELFGYEEGSFTGASKGGKTGLIEAANGGTLFLDEVSELPMEQQVKLLHVLQERILIKVGGTTPIDLNIRVIAATNKDLMKQVELGLFREDLFYRLNVVPLELPPLRERNDDIPLLAKHFFKTFCSKYNKEMQISRNALSMLENYAWPGNIRQLENTIERLVLTIPKPTITAEDLPDTFRNEKIENECINVKKIMKLEEAVQLLEKDMIIKAIEKYGTTVKAAEVLGINQSTVSRKITQYGLKDIIKTKNIK